MKFEEKSDMVGRLAGTVDREWP